MTIVHLLEKNAQEYMLKDTAVNTPEQRDKALSLFKEYFDCAIMN